MSKEKNDLELQNPVSYEELLAAVGVTMEMIAANRRGEVTAAQIERLREHTENAGCAFAIMGGFFLMVGLCFWSNTSFARTPQTLLKPDLGTAVFMALVIIMVGSALWLWQGSKKDALHPTVQVKTGTLKITNEKHYVLRINGITTHISRRAYHLFKPLNGETFLVYYTTNAEFFLSCEPAAWANLSMETILNQSHAASEI